MLAMVETPKPIDASTLRIELLGGFRLTYGEQAIHEISRERLQCLLAYLVLNHGKSQSRQRIAALFWEESGETQARTNLRHELFHLRQMLPQADTFLEIDNKTLLWRSQAPFTLDVVEFEQAIAQAEEAEKQSNLQSVQTALETAIAYYQGDSVDRKFLKKEVGSG